MSSIRSGPVWHACPPAWHAQGGGLSLTQTFEHFGSEVKKILLLPSSQSGLIGEYVCES